MRRCSNHQLLVFLYCVSIPSGNIFKLVVGATPVPWEGEKSRDPSSTQGSSTVWVPCRASSCLSWFQPTGSAQEQPQTGQQYQGLPFGGSELDGTASPEKYRALMGEELTLRMLWVTPSRSSTEKKRRCVFRVRGNGSYSSS